MPIKKGIYTFDSIAFNVANSTLQKGTETIKLSKKQSQVLLLLVSYAGQSVSKQQFFDFIWPEADVEESNLYSTIHSLRRLIEEDPNYPSTIKTVQGLGYEFSAQVVLGDLPSNNPVPDLTVNQDQINPPDEPSVQISPSLGLASARRLKTINLILIIVSLSLIGVILYLSNSIQIPSRIILGDGKRFTSLIGCERYPAFSPDGELIAFTWDGDQLRNEDIYVQQISGSNAVRVTSDPASDILPVWSPDGLSLAFLRGNGSNRKPYRLMITSAFGGSERELALVYGGLDWSPDGQFLAVTDVVNNDFKSGIFILSIDGTSIKNIYKSSNNQNIIFSNPRFSPNGEYLAFLGISNELSSQIFVANLKSGEVKQILKEQVRIQDGSLQWYTNGQSLLFISSNQSQVIASEIKLNDDDKVTALSSPITAPFLATNLNRASFNYSINRTETLVAYVSVLEDDRIKVFDDTKPSNVPCVINSTRLDRKPQLSPDGSHLLFTSNRIDKEQLWISRSDCKELRQLTNFENGSIEDPRWSPDGTLIAFELRQGNSSSIYVMSREGINLTNLGGSDGNNHLPFWSPDGEWVYFASTSTTPPFNNRIFKIRSSGGEPIQVSRSDQYDRWRPQITPDGKTLYFNRNYALWQMDLASGSEVMVREMGNLRVNHNWEITKSGLYYYATDTAFKSNIYRLDEKTRQITRLATVDGEMSSDISSLSVIDSGRRFAVSSIYVHIGDINVMSMSNWK